VAHGEDPSAPFEAPLKTQTAKRAWADAIHRIVLLAGMSRGWSPSSALSWVRTVGWGLMSFFGDVFLGGRPTLFGIRAGAPFLIQTRLQWLALLRRPVPPKFLVVQLLGTQDDMVAPSDAVDFSVDLVGARCTFVLLDVRETCHRSMVDMAQPRLGVRRFGRSPAELRWRVFTHALEATDMQLLRHGIRTDHMTDTLPPEPDPTVSDVVFVVHGIRDRGFWTQKIARAIKLEAIRAGVNVRSVTASYGYFAMAPFLLPWVRRQKVAWLMERYTEARVQYPNARFSYVGHSNGTYLAARALQDYPAARFRRIVFAGSVVRRDYDWRSLMQPGTARVDSVLNYVATSDFVVALFPNGLQPLRFADLGSAGHHGFEQLTGPPPPGPKPAQTVIHTTSLGPEPSYQIHYIGGRHGAGLRESQWDDIARFIVDGKPPKARNPDFVSRQSRVAWLCGLVATPLLIVLAAILLGIGWLLLGSIGGPACADLWLWAPCLPGLAAAPDASEAAYRTLGFMAYVLTLYIFVTRF
jgi:pimeloyl-ACP methyl ester carboxylesterase